MSILKPIDILVNILLPLLAGMLLYYIPSPLSGVPILKTHLADGLWAYAFLSSILIVWDRALNRFWIITAFGAAVLFEALQSLRVFPGTGDIYDVLVYFLFFILALILNKFFRINLKPLP